MRVVTGGGTGRLAGRVRRADVVLAVVAVAGVGSGLVVTVFARLGVTGPVVIGAGVAAAVAVAVPQAAGRVAVVTARRAEQGEALAAILACPVVPVAEADPFAIGVFPSALARQSSRDAASGAGGVPPYVPRDADRALGAALVEGALARSGRLVVLRGDPKSGKSRTLWEAVRVLAGRRLVAVVQPDPGAAAGEAGAAPLVTLAGLDRPVSTARGRDLVIWVDDAQAHLQRGLSRDTLRRLAGIYPGAVIAMTIHASAVDGLSEIDPPLHGLLRRPFDDLFLSPVLGGGELAAARATYPPLAGDADLVRLPELLAAVNLLTDRYRHHHADEPGGVAVARAAISWQRAGQPPGSLTEPELRGLTGLALADIAPNRVLDDDIFARALVWATVEVAAFAALVRREPREPGQPARFRAFDGVVSWARRHDPLLTPATWDYILDHADTAGLISAGIAAYDTGEMETAVRAFGQASDSDQPQDASAALFNKGVVLGRLGRGEEAAEVLDLVEARYGASADPALAEQAAKALYNKGATLGRLGRGEEAVAVLDLVEARYGASADPALAEQAARALFNKGATLGGLGRGEEAVAVYDLVEARYGASADPALAEQAAGALVNKGATLGELGRPEEAVAVYDLVVDRYGISADPALADIAARAARMRNALCDI